MLDEACLGACPAVAVGCDVLHPAPTTHGATLIKLSFRDTFNIWTSSRNRNNHTYFDQFLTIYLVFQDNQLRMRFSGGN